MARTGLQKASHEESRSHVCGCRIDAQHGFGVAYCIYDVLPCCCSLYTIALKETPPKHTLSIEKNRLNEQGRPLASELELDASVIRTKSVSDTAGDTLETLQYLGRLL